MIETCPSFGCADRWVVFAHWSAEDLKNLEECRSRLRLAFQGEAEMPLAWVRWLLGTIDRMLQEDMQMTHVPLERLLQRLVGDWNVEEP